MSFDRPAPFSPGKTQWEALTKEKFQGKRCCFGQLVWYRTKTPGKRTLDPNMAPALFLGWRVDPGLRYRNVVKVMDYEAFRKDGSISVHDVPEPELFVEDGPPSFPIAAAADRALHGGKTEGSDLLSAIGVEAIMFRSGDRDRERLVRKRIRVSLTEMSGCPLCSAVRCRLTRL